MRRVYREKDFSKWFRRFLPGLPAALAKPVTVSDRSDGQLAHLDGLNLCRAWCFFSLAPFIPEKRAFLKTAKDHLASGLKHVASGEYGFFIDFRLEAPPPKVGEKTDRSALPSDFLVGYAPGQPAEILSPGQAKLIKAGSDIVLEVHYTPTGKATTDRARLGIVFAKEPPKERVLTLSATNGTFKIPPGDPNYRVDASFEVVRNVKLSGLHPHMHMRGKDFEYRLVFPGGETRTILRVPAYIWRWQLWYNLAEPIALPKGTKIECTAHFDNSANNPENPDPTKTVIWGQQNWDEMMVGFFNLVFDAKMPAQALLPERDEGAGRQN